MKAAAQYSKAMGFSVRPMTDVDIPQVALIERRAFPTQFPTTPFRRELRNKMASYLVARRQDDESRDSESSVTDAGVSPSRPILDSLLEKAKALVAGHGFSDSDEILAGYLGVWYMVDEAHIVSVAVLDELQGVGVGELLLIAAMEQAIVRGSNAVTLEVRPSNLVARNLYKKYGFEEKGVRKGYYVDNREDAIIMSTEPIKTPEFQDHFGGLTRLHTLRWGQAPRAVT